MPRTAIRLLVVAIGFLPATWVVAADPTYQVEVERFQASREASLRADDGWLTVSGLAWLNPGATRVGADPASAVKLRAGAPSSVGVLTLASNKPKAAATFEPTPGVTVLLNGKPFLGGAIRSDEGGTKADVLAVEGFRLILLRRNDKYVLRIKDNASPTRLEFGGCRWFPVDPNLRVVARFNPHPLPKSITFATIVGGSDVLPSPGTVTFEIDGQTHTLEAADEGDGKLWFVFRDATAGVTTATNARQLTADAPENGAVVLDFNKAINLPCAYIEHATCPIPPTQNRLPIAISAGEQLPGPPKAKPRAF